MNFLPEKEKRWLLMEKKKRVVLSLWILFLFFVFCLILALLSLDTYFKINADSEKVFLESANNKFDNPEIVSFKKSIEIANDDLKKLNVFYENRVFFSKILEDVSNLLPEGIYLNNISISFLPATKKQGKSIEISLSGFSLTREKLLSFRRRLENSKKFSEIVFPPSDWTKSENINFSATFKLNNKKNGRGKS